MVETNEVAMTRASVATDFIMVVLEEELRVEEDVVAAALVEDDVVERRIVGRNE
jgi:hypothetical protein